MKTIAVNWETLHKLSGAQYDPFRRGTLLAVATASVEDADDGNGVALHPAAGPRVGQPCTLLYYTDRAAATVIAVSPTGSRVTVQEDRAVRLDKNGMSDQQTYRYERDPAGRVHVFHRNGRGGYGGRGRGVRLSIGARNSYHDYTF